MVKIRAFGAGLVTLTLLFGCGPGYKVPAAGGERKIREEEKVEVEAYLFDAKLKRQGKPTSFRLEIFQTDSVVALGGRAYLGKGALKGRLTADSLEVYFPSSNEYLYESVSELFQTTECSDTDFQLTLIPLFKTLPDSVEKLKHVSISADYGNRNRPAFDLFLSDCPWRIEMVYDWKDDDWRIRQFIFDNGKGVSLKARRREYKKKARVPFSKFRLAIPDDVLRIIP